MDSDEDDYDEAPQPGHAPSNLSERRRAQKAAFDAWLTSDVGQEALKPKSKEARLKNAADEELSIHSLMAKEGTQIIKNPREYQMELFERAKNENKIAVLDTGSGKTLIAVLLLRHIIDQELEDRATGKAARISFFLVSSVTLVYQQFSVLETNLDHKIARVCGADNTDFWQKAKWTKLFEESRVVVCTAEILHQCLFHSYISMKQINLLIFDEAHHAKKNHNYARIIKDFYFTADESLRPRVFGMTASPIDAKTDVTQAALELETLLHSRIATTDDMSFTAAVKRPAESILRYDALAQPFETKLLQAVKANYGHIDAFRRTFERTPEIARQLGSWCADMFLVDTIAEKRMKKYEERTERKFYARNANPNVKELDDKQAELRAAIDFLEQQARGLYGKAMEEDEISSKIKSLRLYLATHFERPTSQRCIVFVERRHTARLLHALFLKIGPPHMKSSFLVGSGGKGEEDNISFRSQVMTLIKFRQGEINCLFATSVAEEGLDVPDCNLVIRFDMYRTMIQYVQSRGRARQQNSRFIHMMESGNSVHAQLVSEVRFQERAMRKFCGSLPEDRRLIGHEDNLEALLEKEKDLRVFVDEISGSKLTYGNCLAVLANYVSVLPTDSDEPLHPTYVVFTRGAKFLSEVLLPPGSAVRSVIGRVHTKKTLAKRAAAFDACMELRKKGHLDENLMSTQRRRVNAMRNAELALNMKSGGNYVMRMKPSVWAEARGTLPDELWATVLQFPDGLERDHQPLALLTRTRMPEFPPFPLFLNDGRRSTVVCRRLPRAIKLDDGLLDKLSAFTFRVLKDVFTKTFGQDAAGLSYWIAPLKAAAIVGDEKSTADILDMPLLKEIVASDDSKWTPNTPPESLVGKFIVDPYSGGNKYVTLALEPTLSPSDPPPENSSKQKRATTIINNTVSLWKKQKEMSTWHPNQPVLRAQKLWLRLNQLATPDAKDNKERPSGLAYICPEPLIISMLPPEVVTSCFVFPAIIHRLESYLIALEACDVVGVKCIPEMALAAVTKDADNSGEHGEERINFQRGMGENYERLEFIGDTFLKTATTISTYIQNPSDVEADMHVIRMLMLCNKNLFETAQKLDLMQYVRSQAFSRRTWYPEGLKLLEGKGKNKDEATAVIKHSLGDKTVADVCEALIGAAFVSHDKLDEKWNPEQFDPAVRAVTKLVDKPDHAMDNWAGYRAAYNKPAFQTADSTASQRDLAEKVELEHPYHFKYPRLLRSAFMHPSQPRSYESVPSYERIEFLGDALLDQASITHLFYRFHNKDPGWLTEHKMAMVGNKFLGAVCVNIGFHRHLRYASETLEHQIREYATELLEAKRTAGDSRDYWTTVSDPPKCLPDIVESYVGAMFIDSDFDYGVVLDFFNKHIAWYSKTCPSTTPSPTTTRAPTSTTSCKRPTAARSTASWPMKFPAPTEWRLNGRMSWPRCWCIRLWWLFRRGRVGGMRG
ncbi:Dicer-like protein 1 [Saxophila tyrrhenica]|uniref:Dicer-like protein 1 n=1 Tax=Saxophila tyrrhenica TaxID=1690608 RepID=A0AAV9P1G9_9PEZI|nr:Dicer-like protein 1 [Saxophila tyrrhenica]